jgi:hypothetical protein
LLISLTPVSRKSFLYCAPLRYAQAYGARKALLLSVPSTYEPGFAQAPTLARRSWATLFTLFRPLRGWCFADSNVPAPIFIPLGQTRPCGTRSGIFASLGIFGSRPSAHPLGGITLRVKTTAREDSSYFISSRWGHVQHLGVNSQRGPVSADSEGVEQEAELRGQSPYQQNRFFAFAPAKLIVKTKSRESDDVLASSGIPHQYRNRYRIPRIALRRQKYL